MSAEHMDEFERELTAAFQAAAPPRADIQAAVAARVEAYERRRRVWLLGAGLAGVVTAGTALSASGAGRALLIVMQDAGRTPLLLAAAAAGGAILLFGWTRLLAQEP